MMKEGKRMETSSRRAEYVEIYLDDAEGESYA